MAEKDTVEKTLVSYNDVFADIVNALLFSGKAVISEDSLTDAQPFSTARRIVRNLQRRNTSDTL